MTRALVLKELRQHGTALLVVGALVVGGCHVVQRAIGSSGMAGSDFQALGIALVFLLPIAGIIVGHLLVATEFRQKSQLFLEALPLPRWRMVAVKFVIGIIAMVGFGLGALVLTWKFGAVGEMKTPGFAGILAARTVAWSAFVFVFFFMIGFLGRYRIPFLILVGWGALYCASILSLPLTEFPPFRLVDTNRFGFERDTLPVAPLLWTAAIVVGLSAISFFMALVREGSIAARLGEAMSHREKILMGATVFVLVMASAIWDMRRPTPFALPGAVEEESAGVRVSVHPAPDSPGDRSIALASELARTLGSAREFLQIDDWPPVFVVDRTDLEDGTTFRESALENQEGALFYADLANPGYDQPAFVRYVIRRSLAKRSHGRLDREATRWILDGFAEYWHPDDAPALRERARSTVEEHGFSRATVDGWLRFEREAGEAGAHAVAWAGIRTIEAELGSSTLARFLGSVLGRPPYPDSRATIDALRHPTPALFEASSRMGFDALVERWEQHALGEAAP